MSKEILRDKNGRFAKKGDKPATKEQLETIKGYIYELEKDVKRLTDERDEARQEVDRRNMRVHMLTNDNTVLMKENAILMKMCSVFIDYSSWWKRRERKAKIQELAGKLKEVHREGLETSLEHLMEIILK